jgi:hypothetical protein
MVIDESVDVENVALREEAPSMAKGTTLVSLACFYKTSLQATNDPTTRALW